MKAKNTPFLEQKALKMLSKKLDIRHDGPKVCAVVDDNITKETTSDRTLEKVEKIKPEKTKSEKIKRNVKYDHIMIQKVLDMLPAIQADVWKNLGIDRRSCSRLITKMAKEGLIERTKSDHTFLIERLDKKEDTTKKEKSIYIHLLSGDGTFSPCCGCERECNPEICTLLTKWLL